MERQSRQSLNEALREAVRATGKSINAIARESGAQQAGLQRFMSRQRGLNLDTAETLCAYLGLELRPVIGVVEGSPPAAQLLPLRGDTGSSSVAI